MSLLVERIRAGAVGLRNLLVGANLASLPMVRHPRQLLGYVNESLFLLRSYAGTRALEQRNVFEVLAAGDTCPIVLGGLGGSSGRHGDPWFHTIASYASDIVSLCLICRIVRPKTIFEIGTLHGYTAYHFALNSEADARVFTLDLPPDGNTSPVLRTTIVDRWHLPAGEMRQYCFSGTEVGHKITTLFGDSATFDYADFAGVVDFFYIDGAHSYDYVRSDTLHALRCCHPGSVIAWHDYGRVGVNGVSKWLREFGSTRKLHCVPGGSLAFMVVQ